MGLKSATILAVVAGILLIIGNVSGSSGILGIALEFVMPYSSGHVADMLAIVLQALNYIASLGGIAVIVGGLLIYKDRKWIGKFIVRLGAGMGLIGFLLLLVSVIIQGWTSAVAFALLISQSTGWIGIILAITATIMAR